MYSRNRVFEILQDWRYIFRRYSLRFALSALYLDIARLTYQHLRLYIFTCSLREPLPLLQPNNLLEVYRFESSHLEMVRSTDQPSHALLCERQLRLKNYGLIAIHEGQYAGYAWGSEPANREKDHIHRQFETGDILCDNAYTVPKFRGKGVQTALTLARFKIFRELGYKRAICYIEVNNKPSLTVWQNKFKAQVAGEIDFLRIGPWYRVRSKMKSEPSKPITHSEESRSALSSIPKEHHEQFY